MTEPIFVVADCSFCDAETPTVLPENDTLVICRGCGRPVHVRALKPIELDEILSAAVAGEDRTFMYGDEA